jgi:hypothetical protein
MNSTLDRWKTRYRIRMRVLKASVSKLLSSLKPSGRGFAAQRMCPFCGLITPRAKASCLECGKSLAPATAR